MLRGLAFLTCLVSFWLLLSGMFTPFLVAAGVGSAMVILLLSRHMDALDTDSGLIQLSWPSLFTYVPWLLKEIVKSGLDVSWRVLHPALPISPRHGRVFPEPNHGGGLGDSCQLHYLDAWHHHRGGRSRTIAWFTPFSAQTT